jgi:hypothetical protein
LTSD